MLLLLREHQKILCEMPLEKGRVFMSLSLQRMGN